MALVVLALVAVLCGAPAPASGADVIDAGARQAGNPPAASGADAAPAADALTVPPVGIAVGLGGIVALVLLACYVVLPRRRRGVGSRSNAHRADVTTRTTAEDVATAALHRRTLRRAKVRLEEDPILASMGVGSAKRASKPGVGRRRAARRSPPT